MAYLSTDPSSLNSVAPSQVQAAVRKRLREPTGTGDPSAPGTLSAASETPTPVPAAPFSTVQKNIAGEDPGNSADPAPSAPEPPAPAPPPPPAAPQGPPANDVDNEQKATGLAKLFIDLYKRANPKAAPGDAYRAYGDKKNYPTDYTWATGTGGNYTDAQLLDFWNQRYPAPSQTSETTAAPPVNGYPIQAASNPWLDQIRQLILARLKAAGGPVDPNSPEIANAVAAARNEAQRASALERTQLAERLYAQGQGGLGTDALTRQIQQSGEKNAASISSLRANLIQQGYTQKFSELQNLLQLAVASGDAESARGVQLQLAALQAAVQRESIGANLAISGQNNNNITVAGGA